MFLVDRLSVSSSSPKKFDEKNSSDIEAENSTAGLIERLEENNSRDSQSNRALIGILVHSAVDGLALGAISLSENSSLELIVFIAIILHKAPAAFGLVSFLISQGRPIASVKFSLALFSAAAPISALLTFAIFAFSSPSAADSLSRSTLGLLLLFSGGTFLFTIALHILPELNSLNDGEEISRSAHSHDHSSSPPSWRYVAAIIAGIASPCLMAFAPHPH